ELNLSIQNIGTNTPPRVSRCIARNTPVSPRPRRSRRPVRLSHVREHQATRINRIELPVLRGASPLLPLRGNSPRLRPEQGMEGGSVREQMTAEMSQGGVYRWGGQCLVSRCIPLITGVPFSHQAGTPVRRRMRIRA